MFSYKKNTQILARERLVSWLYITNLQYGKLFFQEI